MKTHIGYETAKRLKEFCPNLPEPMDGGYHIEVEKGVVPGYGYADVHTLDTKKYPAYQLHDILSKSFCEAMAKARNSKMTPQGCFVNLADKYWLDGIPAVEAELMKMMEAL